MSTSNSADIYFSADVETDGPIPGPYSMLSFAFVRAGAYDGRHFVRPRRYDQHLYVELRPISDKFEVEALRVNGLDRELLLVEGQDPRAAMTLASEWIAEQSQGGNPVLVAYPLSFDWTWLFWYFTQFSKHGSPFEHSRCFDLKTAYAVKAAAPISQSGRSRIPAALRGAHAHTHHALDDAIEQAELFGNIFQWTRTTEGSEPMNGTTAPETVSGAETLRMPPIVTDCRARTESKLAALVDGLKQAQAPEIVADRAACVYATGSLGRGEMSEHSDLDIFVLRNGSAPAPLTNLDEIRLTARLVEVARAQHYPDFSGDGKYVKAHDVQRDLIGKLGTSEDDYANVFTARMLLILESRPILGEETYKEALDSVVATYWRDYAQNSQSFLPVFLMNDILRFWKTLCLNYEERTGSEKATKTGKRRLHNYKLKHSRLLTCYSAIVHMQAVLHRDRGSVSPEAVMSMISQSPTRRLEFVARQRPDASAAVQRILDDYARFLAVCDADRTELESKFVDPDFKKARFAEATEFGEAVFSLLHRLGEGTPLLRYLVV